jgi:hypothetical protein
VVPTAAERDAIRAAIASLIKSGAAARAVAEQRVTAIGFEIVDVADLPSVVLIRESESRRRGGGAYLVRFGSRPSQLAVEAPHTFFDEGTLPLACDLFARTNAVALFVNTAHRYKSSPPDARGDHPSDVAHSADSLFQAATEGLIEAVPAPTVVQLHGFAGRANDTSLVLSAGEKRGGDELVTRAQAALARVVTGVKKYPEDAGELGATTNVQGQIVREAGGRFLHVELESGLRRQLLADMRLRASLLDALATSLAEPK